MDKCSQLSFSGKRLLEPASMTCVFVIAVWLLYIASIYPVLVGVLLWSLADRIVEEMGLWSDPVPSAGVFRNQLYVVRIVMP